MNRYDEENVIISKEIEDYATEKVMNNTIAPALYREYNVFRGLRDDSGKGVLTGLTRISEVDAKKIVDGKTVYIDGKLYYRGYEIHDLINYFQSRNEFGFEKVIYLLLFGNLPDKDAYEVFNDILSKYRYLPSSFVVDFIMKSPSADVMNYLSRSVLMLYSFDDNPNSTDTTNVIKQCLKLIARFPQIAVYGYHAYSYYLLGGHRFFIREPRMDLSIAENFLYMLRFNGKFTDLEAKTLDVALILHAEHGGGNNSTFTTRVVSSSGTDTYSAIAAALGSLKGPKHGGANIKVCQMFRDIKQNVKDTSNKQELEAYLEKILDGEAFDKSGLIYGMGHAVYSLSDPRAEIFKGYVEKLSHEKGLYKEYEFYKSVEEIGKKLIQKKKKINKGVCVNIDFYSGFVYQMLDLPEELFTPMFAIARIAGWSAHRIEELTNSSKIIRPAYESVQPVRNLLEDIKGKEM